MLRLFATNHGIVLERDGICRRPARPVGIDTIFTAADPVRTVGEVFLESTAVAAPLEADLLAPIQSQEVWAAGVTYLRSKTARMEEARDAGGGDFYDRVYDAVRPEVFFKATPHRVVGCGGKVRIRSDSKWNVPEPELTLAVNSAGRIFGYTVGNDMSSRDIEGENPLYLPQAKSYLGSAALGPCIVLTDELPASTTVIAMDIRRGGQSVFAGTTSVGQIKRPLASLVEFLFRDNAFPGGAFLMTGTGIVPPDAFTLQRGDEVCITIEPVGTLRNTVA
jgi:2-dehydro-3-deoxy-D-arabinonate dehydratase